MYSKVVSSTSNLYQNNPHQQNYMSNMNTRVQPPFAPIQHQFGENFYENFHGQHQNSMTMPPSLQQRHHMSSYPPQATPSQGFTFPHGQVIDNYSLTPQAQPQVERNVEEDVLVVQLEHPLFPLSKARLRWTPELHRRFNRAALELGGYFKATPKAILRKMNVRGLSTDHLKSHLQSVRNRVNVVRPSSTEEGVMSVETPSNFENGRTAPFNEDPEYNFKFDFEDFDSLPMLPPPNPHNLRSAMSDNCAGIEFTDADFY